MTSRAFVIRALRILSLAALLAVALDPVGLHGLHSIVRAATTSGGCSGIPNCYLLDVTLSGTGSGTYRTIDANSTFTGRIDCRYGNEKMTGTCGWGYEPPEYGVEYGIVYKVTPDPGSQVCDASTCHGSDEVNDFLFITTNYSENRWHFELIDPAQVNVAVMGTGSGTVTSDQAGIDCPSDCGDLFPLGYPVQLTAKAAAGSVFAGWSGDCSGTEPTCDFGPVSLTSVTATFNKKATSAPPTKPPATAAPTEEPTEEPTEPATTPTATPAAPTDAATIGSSPEPGPTAAPTPASDSGGGNLPIVIGLALVLVVLAVGAVYVAKRPSAGR